MASLAAWDVTPSQMRAVRVLTAHDGGVRSSELAQLLRIAPRSATEVVDALEAKGLVQRSPDPTDRRATLVSLTATGRRAHRGGTPRPRPRVGAALRPAPKTDRAHLSRILRQLQTD